MKLNHTYEVTMRTPERTTVTIEVECFTYSTARRMAEKKHPHYVFISSRRKP